MNFIEASVFILFIAVISVPLANRLFIPLEIFLFVGSCLLSLSYGLPVLTIDPTIVFDLFLPPILFSAAFFTSWRDFKFNLRPITLLAFGLVLFTTVFVAIVAKLIFPYFSWAEAFLLGAILSPTDASATTSLIKKFRVPKRLIVVLDGESLINDTGALILYKFSLAAIAQGSFSIPLAIGEFVFSTLGGIIFGLAIGYAGLYILKMIKDTLAETALTFIVAFTSFLLAQHLGVSGVISTVTAGIYFGIMIPEQGSSSSRINANASWKTVIFIINGAVFTLIGFALPSVLSNLKNYSLSNLLINALIISFTVIALRIIWVYPSAYLSRLLFPSIRLKDPMPSWQYLFALGWAGMRGIVSLAAALAIPQGLVGGHGDVLIFLTYFVVAVSLLVPTLTLPYIFKIAKLIDPEAPILKLREEAKARILAIDEAIKHVSHLAEKEKIPLKVLNEFLDQLKRRREVIHTQIEPAPYSTICNEYSAFKKLTYAAIDAERKTFNKLRKSGEIPDDIFWNLIDELDVEEVRAHSLRV